MIESLYIAESGLNSQQKLIEIISNNIANTATPAFKRAEANFVDLVVKGTDVTPTTDAHAQDIMSGVRVSGLSTDFTVGSLKQTNNPFDVAINGAGFLEVEQADGSFAYTRAGRLRLNEDGYFTDSNGFKLSSNVQIPPDTKQLEIARDGNVYITVSDQAQPINAGKLELVMFSNVEGLAKAGDNLFISTDSSGEAIYGGAQNTEFGEVIQGYAEQSNVSMNEEMVNLMLAQRGYQLNARIIQVTDQVLETINNLRR